MSHTTQTVPAGRHRAVLIALAAFGAGALARLTHRWRARRAAPGQDTLILAGGRGDGPPDLDELWRDLNKKLGGLFGGKGQPPKRGNGAEEPGNSGGPSFPADPRSAGIGVLLIVGVVALIWLGSGFFIVQEGEQAVVTSFGKYSRTEDAGFKWRMPYPFQAHETVRVTQLRSREVGKNAVVPATGLRDDARLVAFGLFAQPRG